MTEKQCDHCHLPFVPRDARQKLHPECRRARAIAREQKRCADLRQSRKSPLRGRTGATIMEHHHTRPYRFMYRADFLLAFPEMKAELERQCAESTQRLVVPSSHDPTYLDNRRSA
jgi:hypothetical protein